MASTTAVVSVSDCWGCCECDCGSDDCVGEDCEGECTWTYHCDECECEGICESIWTPGPDACDQEAFAGCDPGECEITDQGDCCTCIPSVFSEHSGSDPVIDVSGCCGSFNGPVPLTSNGPCSWSGSFTMGSCGTMTFSVTANPWAGIMSGGCLPTKSVTILSTSCDGATYSINWGPSETGTCTGCGGTPFIGTGSGVTMTGTIGSIDITALVDGAEIDIGGWSENSTCLACPGCDCTFDDMANGSQPGDNDIPPPDRHTAQTFSGTCSGSGYGGYGGYGGVSALIDDPYDPSGGPCYWVLTNDCGESNDSGCQCAGKQCDWEWGMVDPAAECNGMCQYDTDTGELIFDPCGEGCACPDGIAGNEFQPCQPTGEWAVFPSWNQTSDCGCENCTCAEPPPLSPIPGRDDGETAVTNCSGEGTSGTINCDCDIPIASTNDCLTGVCNYTYDSGEYTYLSDNCDSGCGCPDALTVASSTAACIDSNATGYEVGETATTPCYGGPCDTSNAACCAGGECNYLWDGYEDVWIPGTSNTCVGECDDPDVDCQCHEPTYSGTQSQESGDGACMPVVTTAALSNRTFGLSSKIPQIRNSREEIRNSSALKVTRKGVSKVYLNVKAIKRKRRAMARKVASRRQRMR
jgi:hypothetical protein